MTPTPIDLLLEAGRRGHKIEVHGDKLQIIPQCPPEFADLVRCHKQRLLTLLQLPFVMVYSKALEEILFFCQDEATKVALVEAGADSFSIYTKAELKVLCEHNRVSPISNTELRKVHELKRVFNARITSEDFK
jgi:hypothetical protein